MDFADQKSGQLDRDLSLRGLWYSGKFHRIAARLQRQVPEI